MKERVQCGVTAGVAVVGASVMAIAPVAVPMPTAQRNRPVTSTVELAAAANPLEVLAPGLTESGQNVAGTAALTPLSPAVAAIAIAAGDNDLLYSVIRQSIDAPLWAADPTIDALANALPDQADAIHGFRDDVLWAATNAIRTPIGQALGADEPAPGENPVRDFAEALARSGERLVGDTAIAPLGLVAIAGALAEGNKEDLYLAIRNYIDAPLHIVDPVLGTDPKNPAPEGLKKILPGSADDIQDFRDNVLWKATFNTREPIRKALDLPEGTGDAAPAEKKTTAELTNLTVGADNATKTGANATKDAGGKDSDNRRPVSTALKAINNQLRESAERLGQAAKNLSGADERPTKAEPTADSG
jgi:hypothetical protein